MQIVKGNIKDAVSIAGQHQFQLNAIAFTCNGSVRRNNGVVGNAVLGRGTGKWANATFSGLGKALGQLIVNNPTRRVFRLKREALDYDLLAVKTKNAWQDDANLQDVEKAIKELVAVTDTMKYNGVIVPMLGTGSGKLAKSDVLPIMDTYLDDRFLVIDYNSDEPTWTASF